MELHRVLGTYEDFMRESWEFSSARIHAKGQKDDEYIKEFYLIESGAPTPSVSVVSKMAIYASCLFFTQRVISIATRSDARTGFP